MLSMLAERLLNDKDFIDAIVRKILNTPISELKTEKVDITEPNVAMLQKAIKEESGDSISMDVLCYDIKGDLKKVSSVMQVLFVEERLDINKFVLRVVKESKAGEPIANIGLLIS